MGYIISDSIVSLFYLVAAILFILGLKGLAHPRTAVTGNLMAAGAMFIAVVVTLLNNKIIGLEIVIAGVIIGAVIGTALATKVPTTSMPQLVALFNGFGGGASALIAGSAFEKMICPDVASCGLILVSPSLQFTVASSISALIGAITLTGSLVAFGKLQGVITEKPILLPARHLINLLLLISLIGLVTWLVINPVDNRTFWILVGTAGLLGILLVVPIGGADMPVVISLLNSYSGLAAAATGFVLENNILIIAGSLVGAAGLILTRIMSTAMNRSLVNVLFAGVGAVVSNVADGQGLYAGRVKTATPDEVAMLLDGARKLVIVPGFGMAVAQAQYAVRDLVNLLDSKGVEVLFAIHPVAGRMPGHMNVLLAEVDIPYDKLKEMDEINPSFPEVDMALIIGANDVVNPVARDLDPTNPIAGMPILDVDFARSVVVVKRSLSPGFAGIPNPLFVADNTVMLFGDAKNMIVDLVAALK
jgi:NAD(P) transhydrogenase subunit beta